MSRGAEWLVLRLFDRAKTGTLELVYPDGRRRFFGGLSPFPRATIEVRSENFWGRCVLGGAIGFGESYLEGEWETPDLTSTIAFFVLNSEFLSVFRKPEGGGSLFGITEISDRFVHWMRRNTRWMARRNIEEHYDLGNDFFRLWLDPTMTYSCAYFEEAGLSLEQAQLRKYERLCRMLQIGSSDYVLEIGSGWGGFAVYAAKTRGCRVTGITISPSQLEESRMKAEREGVAERVRFELRDYRDERGIYDKIVSIEMIEAVGDEYLEDYFATCTRCLKKNGLLGLQMIVCPDRQYEVLRSGVDFIQKHIFPGSLLVAQHRVNRAMMRTGDLNLWDWKDLGVHYAETLRQWGERFEAVREEVKKLGFSDKFLRKWRYYLAYCEAAFAMRHISVVQAIYTRPNNLSLGFGPHARYQKRG